MTKEWIRVMQTILNKYFYCSYVYNVTLLSDVNVTNMKEGYYKL